MDDIRRRMDVTERNQTDLARTITNLVNDVHEMRKPLDELKTDREVRKEREKNLNERLDRMEDAFSKGIDDLKTDMNSRWGKLQMPLWAAASALIGCVVVAVWQFIVRGGLHVGP